MKNFLVFVGLICLGSCSPRSQEAPPLKDTLLVEDSVFYVDSASFQISETLPLPKDTVLDNMARFIGGLSQLDSNSYTLLQQDKYWTDYQKSMDESWAKMDQSRLSKIKQWQDSVFSATHDPSLPLFYPFSGPDFLHAFYLYPHASEYILAALEPVTEIPPLDTLSVTDRDKFLDSLGNSLRDIFQKSYFITTHMKKDLKIIKGVLPPLYFFMQRSGFELISREFITLDTEGIPVPVDFNKLHWQKTPGVKFVIRHRESQTVKTVYYFSISISNQGLKERPEFQHFIQQRAPFNTFVKSASYLMHLSTFADIRQLILEQSASIFQDDTGLPYRFVKNDTSWQVSLYGEYTKPVKDFGEEKFQKDLDSAYRNSTRSKLPFSLGYHWGSNKQNYQLLKKKF
jgi:hypothetical protein